MASRSRSRTGVPEVDGAIESLLQATSPTANADLYRELLTTVANMVAGDPDRGDLKIANGALREMWNSFAKFEAESSRPKVSVFGSARITPDQPVYQQAHELGAALAAAGWMIISGGGPGIMSAVLQGAGPSNGFAVTIRLPFEQSAGSVLVDEAHVVKFKYFFTRKLAFMNEASAYVVFPGGFGTLDETFELLTLVQTGKENPAPVVLIDPPGEDYWATIISFVQTQLVAAGLVSADDLGLIHLTSTVPEAVTYINSFYANYHSMRYVDDCLVVRTRRPLTDEALATINREFADIVRSGRIEPTAALAAEVVDDDFVDLPRLRFDFDRHHFARLQRLVRRLGELDVDLPPAS